MVTTNPYSICDNPLFFFTVLLSKTDPKQYSFNCLCILHEWNIICILKVLYKNRLQNLPAIRKKKNLNQITPGKTLEDYYIDKNRLKIQNNIGNVKKSF